jgi:hypothetical protein
VGQNQTLVLQWLYLLSYFIRCSEVLELQVAPKKSALSSAAEEEEPPMEGLLRQEPPTLANQDFPDTDSNATFDEQDSPLLDTSNVSIHSLPAMPDGFGIDDLGVQPLDLTTASAELDGTTTPKAALEAAEEVAVEVVVPDLVMGGSSSGSSSRGITEDVAPRSILHAKVVA